MRRQPPVLRFGLITYVHDIVHDMKGNCAVFGSFLCANFVSNDKNTIVIVHSRALAGNMSLAIVCNESRGCGK